MYDNSGGYGKKAQRMIELCDVILDSLYEAQPILRSARNWGIVDILGGGFITNLIKHSKLDRARQMVERANDQMHLLKKEMKSAHIPEPLYLDIGGFATFADFFFDGMIADVYMQSKISDLRNSVDYAIQQISHVREVLEEMKLADPDNT